MKIPQFIPFLGEEEYREIRDCFENKWITEGPKAKEFREKICECLSVKNALFVSNGTVSLYLALKALGIGPGDEVIVPDITFAASGNAVEMTGAVPLFCEVNSENFQIDLAKAHLLISEKTKAIMPVPLYGMALDYDEMLDFVRQHKLAVIEDAAQALGVKFKNKHCGTFGNIGSFSFYADKIITTGEGGLLVTDNDALYEALLYLVNHGRLKTGTFIHEKTGYNFRMTDLQLAVGLAQFRKIQEIIRHKTRIAEQYKFHLNNIPEVRFTIVPEHSSYIPFRFVIIAGKAHQLMRYLEGKGIAARTIFYPMHKQPCFQKFRDYKHPHYSMDDRHFPNANFAYDSGVCLPTYPALSNGEIEYICMHIRKFYEQP